MPTSAKNLRKKKKLMIKEVETTAKHVLTCGDMSTISGVDTDDIMRKLIKTAEYYASRAVQLFLLRTIEIIQGVSKTKDVEGRLNIVRKALFDMVRKCNDPGKTSANDKYVGAIKSILKSSAFIHLWNEYIGKLVQQKLSLREEI